jgi:hypothetical protein
MTVGGAAALVKAKEAGRFRHFLGIVISGENRAMMEVCGDKTALSRHSDR